MNTPIVPLKKSKSAYFSYKKQTIASPTPIKSSHKLCSSIASEICEQSSFEEDLSISRRFNSVDVLYTSAGINGSHHLRIDSNEFSTTTESSSDASLRKANNSGRHLVLPEQVLEEPEEETFFEIPSRSSNPIAKDSAFGTSSAKRPVAAKPVHRLLNFDAEEC
mmetsp:Transcript_20729/g.18138  ORF Transcript_20729/g.18138 Transcript_20729/m.18138 type:complete len:164 (-) Transcript_20729:274-765(-)